MKRRRFLQALGVGAVGAATEAAQQRDDYHLRYAPRIGLVSGLPIPRQLEIYAEWGFRAFEYNGLPRHSNQEIERFRAKREELDGHGATPRRCHFPNDFAFHPHFGLRSYGAVRYNPFFERFAASAW